MSNTRDISYDYLVLATGSHAFMPQLPGIHLDNVMSLRSLDQAVNLKERLKTSKKLVVLGGGLIGLEVAAATTKLNIDTVVIEKAPMILARLLPKTVASHILNLHEKLGVKICLDMSVDAIIGSEKVEGVRLTNGDVLEADTVLVATGAAPNTSLAKKAGLEVDKGVIVNEYLQTSIPNIYAAGDIAQFPVNGEYQRHESWKNATEQGATVAANIMGEHAPFKSVPWMWSDQFDTVIQIAGIPDARDTEVIRVLKDGGIMTFHLSENGVLKAACAFGDISHVAKSIRVATTIIDKQMRPDTSLLTDPDADLRKIMKSLSATSQPIQNKTAAAAIQ